MYQDEQKLKQVNIDCTFNYIGSRITAGGKIVEDTKLRITQTNVAFSKREKLIMSENVNLGSMEIFEKVIYGT